MDKILTQLPQGKKGVNISNEKYDIIRKAIIDSLKSNELTFTLLTEKVKERLNNIFEGAIGWYVETVKLDLEAKNIIERIPQTNPQLYRLKK
jgi:hypothetical protein